MKEVKVAKPNYSYEKRQRELEKKKKKEEKMKRKLSKGATPDVLDESEAVQESAEQAPEAGQAPSADAS